MKVLIELLKLAYACQIVYRNMFLQVNNIMNDC